MISEGNSGRNRSSKLKNQIIPESELKEPNEIISAPPANAIDPNISGLAKISLNSDFSDIQAELDAIQRKEGDSNNKFKTNLMIISLSAVVVASAIIVTIFQSMLLSANHYYFPFPLFSAAVTNLVQLLGAAVVLGYYGRLGLLSREIWSRQGFKATYQAILPCSIVTAAELSISLISLQYVTVSFFTMVKSSSIIFILLGAFITGQERVNLFLISVILLTGIGVVLAAWDPKSTAGLEVIGFSLVLLSSILNAAKWILTELLLNENAAFQAILEKLNAPNKTNLQSKSRNLTPILSVFLIAPITFVFLLFGAILLEGFPLQMFAFLADESVSYASITLGSLLLTSFVVFIMRVADFRLVQLVSLVTFSLLGIFKEIIMILISILFLGERLFFINTIGLVLTIIGVILYNYYRIIEDRQREAIKRGQLEIELQLRRRRTVKRKNLVFNNSAVK